MNVTSSTTSCSMRSTNMAAITLGIYSHVAPTLHDEAAGQVADRILGGWST